MNFLQLFAQNAIEIPKLIRTESERLTCLAIYLFDYLKES